MDKCIPNSHLHNKAVIPEDNSNLMPGLECTTGRLLGGNKKRIAQRRASLRDELLEAIDDLGTLAVEQVVHEVLLQSSL